MVYEMKVLGGIVYNKYRHIGFNSLRHYSNSWKGLLTIPFSGEVVYYMRIPDSMVNLCSWRNGLWQYLVNGL
jgi:hypothetical protein